MWSLLVFCCAVALTAESATLPSYIKKCKNDGGLNACIIKNSKEAIAGLVKGEPKLGIPSMNPLRVEKIEQTSGGSSSVSLNLTLTDVDIYGIPNAQLIKSEFDTKKHILKVAAKIPLLKILSKYNLNGKFILVPVLGNGKLTLILDNVLLTLSANYNLVKRKGVEYASVVTPINLQYTTTKVTLNFENLFNGDKNLGNNFNKLINENWREWDAVAGKSIGQALGDVIGMIMKNTLNRVAYKDLFI